jgi:hypothetical protein
MLEVFFFLVCEAIGTEATPGLLCQPRVIVKMIVEKQMECSLAGETDVLGRKPAPAPLLSITKSHITRPGFEPGPPRWECLNLHTTKQTKKYQRNYELCGRSDYGWDWQAAHLQLDAFVIVIYRT